MRDAFGIGRERQQAGPVLHHLVAGGHIFAFRLYGGLVQRGLRDVARDLAARQDAQRGFARFPAEHVIAEQGGCLLADRLHAKQRRARGAGLRPKNHAVRPQIAHCPLIELRKVG